MKTWFAVLSVAALICGSVACHRHDNDTYSRTDTNAAQARRDATGDVSAEADAGTRSGAGTGTGTDAGRTGSMGSGAGMGTQAHRVLTGKLTVKDQTARTFQLDDSGATYVAPSETNISRYDGQEVTVQIDENGRVQDIRVTSGAASDREG